MKKRLYSALIVLTMLLSLLPMNVVFAETVESGTCGDGVTWTLDSEGTLTISGSGAMDDTSSSSASQWAWECKSLVIESGVTYIGAYAFNDCKYLTNITIKSGVQKIGSHAFSNCIKLTEATLNEDLVVIETGAFYGCSSLISINIPKQIKTISSWVFGNCTSLEIVNIPYEIEEIGYSAFSGCIKLKEITLPDSITVIGERAFEKCSLISISKLPKMLSKMGANAFQGCASIEKIEIPETLTVIEYFAFADCTALKSIIIPQTIANIQPWAFKGCTNLEKVYIDNMESWCRISFGRGSSDMGTCNPLYYGAKLYVGDSLVTSLTLPNSVEKINDFQFWGCSSIISVTLPKSITSIGLSAFNNCNNITAVKYAGNSDDWNKITIAYGNSVLTSANITYNASDILLNKSELLLTRGNSEKLLATTSQESANIMWTSSNNNIATVSDDGTVTAVSAGIADVIATINNGAAKAICRIKVTPIETTGVTLDKYELSISAGTNSTLKATVIPENADNKDVTWLSSNNDIASVDDNGNVTAKSVGTSTITVTTISGNYTAECVVTVLPVNVDGITLDKSTVSVSKGYTTNIIATITPENATDKTVLWSSNNENIATVENGTITAVSQGTAVIVAKTKDGSYTAYCAVTVTAANVSVTGISLNQSTLTIVEGDSETLVAAVKPENATNKKVKWITSNANIATVENGLVKGIAPGATVIIATTEDGGQIATCIVNVISAMQDPVSKPIASVLSGAVQEGTNILLLSATRGAEIYYTTDGSAPTKESKLYSQPIKINEATKIKAIAVKDDMIDSDISSFSYTIADPNVPYVSVQTNLIGNKGDITTVSVNISENSSSAGGSFNLVYDNTAVELLSVENGNYISKANPIVNDSYAPNKIRTVWAGSKALVGGGEILTAQFRILDDTDKDAAYFNLEKLKLADDNAVKMNFLQSDGVLALMKAESTISDKEFVTESTIDEDNKTISVTVTSNGDNIGKMYAAVYDDNNKLIQLKCMDVKNNITPYNIVFDREVQSGQLIKIFVWDNAMRPLSDVELLQK